MRKCGSLPEVLIHRGGAETRRSKFHFTTETQQPSSRPKLSLHFVRNAPDSEHDLQLCRYLAVKHSSLLYRGASKSESARMSSSRACAVWSSCCSFMDALLVLSSRRQLMMPANKGCA